jgi:ABC-type phosphate transport system substrate-binding protein
MQHTKFFTSALTALLVLVLAGCGNQDSRFSRVEGTVTYNGQPLEGAVVSFQPVAQDGVPASGTTDANGRFSLTSVGAAGGGTGAMPGEYVVAISKRDTPPPDPDQEAYDRGDITYDELQTRLSARDSQARGATRRSLIPERYSTGRTSDLTATVVSGRNSPFVFDLVD